MTASPCPAPSEHPDCVRTPVCTPFCLSGLPSEEKLGFVQEGRRAGWEL